MFVYVVCKHTKFLYFSTVHKPFWSFNIIYNTSHQRVTGPLLFDFYFYCCLTLIFLWLHRVKHRLHEILHSNEDFKEEDFAKVCLFVFTDTAYFLLGVDVLN